MGQKNKHTLLISSIVAVVLTIGLFVWLMPSSSKSQLPNAEDSLLTSGSEMSQENNDLLVAHIENSYKIREYISTHWHHKQSRLLLALDLRARGDSALINRDTSAAIHWYKASICKWPTNEVYITLSEIAINQHQYQLAFNYLMVQLNSFDNAEEIETELRWKAIHYNSLIQQTSNEDYRIQTSFYLLMQLAENGNLEPSDYHRPEMKIFENRPDIYRLFSNLPQANFDSTAELFSMYTHYYQPIQYPYLLPYNQLHKFKPGIEITEMGYMELNPTYEFSPVNFVANLPFWRLQNWGDPRKCKLIGKADLNGNTVTLFIVDTLRRSNASPPEFHPIYAFWLIHNAQGRLLDYKIVARQYNTETSSLVWESANRLVTTVYNRKLERPYHPGHHNRDNRVEEVTEAFRLAFSIREDGHIHVDTLHTEVPESNLSQN